MGNNSFIKQLKNITTLDLPGEISHLPLMPLSRPLSSNAKARSTTYRESGVGIILHPKGDSVECILIERPPYDGAHGGQISFPGGKRDQSDIDLEFTARRECFEEVGLPIGYGEKVLALTEVFIPVSDFLVQPFIFFVKELPTLFPDNREVKSIISFDLFSLLDDTLLKRKTIKLQNGISIKNIPYFDIQEHVVWGATAMILSEVKAILLQLKL